VSTNNEYLEDDVKDEEIEGPNKQAGRKKLRIKKQLIRAFTAYQEQQPGGLDLLLTLVRTFAYNKLYYIEYEFKNFGTAETVDDWAQNIVIDVWQQLDATMTPDKFYAWVHKITYNHGVDAFNDVLKQKSQKVGLTTVVNGDDGPEEIDNPEIYKDSGGYDGRFRLPDEITGINRDICNLLMSEIDDFDDEGTSYTRTRTYAEIGRILGISESAVKKRIERMRAKHHRDPAKRAERLKAKDDKHNRYLRRDKAPLKQAAD